MAASGVWGCGWRKARARVAALAGGCLLAGVAAAAPPARPLDDRPEDAALPEAGDQAQPRWVLGMGAVNGPERAGGSQRVWRTRPVMAVKLGRWTLATSSVRGLAREQTSGGLSTELAQSGAFSLGLGLRYTTGRSADGDALLEGLPRVPASVALRLNARLALPQDWSLQASLQQDLAHELGSRWALGVGRTVALPAGWVGQVGAGVGWASGQALRVHYGVPAEAVQPQRPLWQPGAGWEQWQWGVGASRALGPHWHLSLNWNRAQLLGAAAASPLTLKRSAQSLQLTLAYVAR